MARITFTGGAGKAGKHVIPELLKRGHKLLNLDLIPLKHPDVFDIKTDLTNSGEVFNAFTSHYGFDGFSEGKAPSPPDVVIHFAAYSRVMIVPDNETFRTNTISTYNVIEAACKLGVKKIMIASSETQLADALLATYGNCFAEGDVDVHSYPLEEDYDVDPMDSYALSKICGEKTARSFARRYPGTDIYVLRIGNVIEPSDYEDGTFKGYVTKPEGRKRSAWSYIDARDLGGICDFLIKKSGLGYQIFNAVNDTNTLTVPTKEHLQKVCPNVPITRELGEWEAPLSNRKLRELGFKEEHNWRDYVKL